jgi:hypothetical protein
MELGRIGPGVFRGLLGIVVEQTVRLRWKENRGGEVQGV